MKNIVKAVLTVILFLIPAFGLFSQTTGPREAQTVADVYVDKGGLVYSKQRQGPNAAGEYTIYLKTFVTGSVSTVEENIATEYVLVLDLSGSMNDDMNGNSKTITEWGYEYPNPDFDPNNVRIDVLQDALAGFINKIKENDKKNKVDSKIAIVKYAGNAYYPNETSLAEGDHSYNQTIPGFNPVPNANYAEVVKGFTSVSTGSDNLISAINNLHAAGSTASDYGMRKAELLIETLFDGDSNEEEEEEEEERTNKVVVLFTDGDPTYSNGFQTAVANRTITTSQRIKSKIAYTLPNGDDVNVKVYTVGMFTSKPGNSTDRGKYMQRVSSNWPNATGLDEGGTGGSNDGNYYFVATRAQELIDALTSIQKDEASASISLDESSTCVDVVSQSFDIPYILDPDTGEPITDVKVWTTPLVNITSDNQYIFARTGWQPAAVTLTVDPVNAGSVSVEGFDYAENACAMVNNQPQGNQLIIEIPIKMDETAVGGQNVATNGPGSGIHYFVEEDGQQVEKVITFDSPTINLPVNLEIEKIGLEKGESAKFRIQRKKATDTEWADYTTVFVTKKEDNTGFSKNSTVKIVGLDPEYVYRIIEDEGWSWSYGGTTVTGKKYDPDTGAESTVTTMSNGTAAQNWNDNTVLSTSVNLNPITFTNKKKDAQVRYAESIVINNYKGVTEETAGHTENSKEQPE